MATFYVVDKTSRMYGYRMPEDGIKVRIGQDPYTVTLENQRIVEFENAIFRGETITVFDENRGNAVFNGTNLIGVQIHFE